MADIEDLTESPTSGADEAPDEADAARATTVFRALVVVSTVLYVVGYWPPAFDSHIYSDDVNQLRVWHGFTARVHLTTLGQLMWFAADVSVPILMLFYIPWARPAFLFLSAAGAVAQLGWGLQVGTPIEAFLTSVILLADGAALAMAYFSPVSHRFNSARARVQPAT